MQYLYFFLLGLPAWGILIAARKWSFKKRHAKQDLLFAQGTPIAHLLPQTPAAPSHHWMAWGVGTFLSLAAAYGLNQYFEANQTAEFGIEVGAGVTLLACVCIAIAHHMNRLFLPAATYTLPEA